jgi:hypothetical protein
MAPRAKAIHLRLAVIPSDQDGMNAKVKYAPDNAAAG